MIPRKFTVNLTIIALLGVAFLGAFFSPTVPFWGQLLFESAKLGDKPWSMLTYPFAIGGGLGFLGLIFAAIWLYQVGHEVERELTSTKYALTLLSLVFLGAIFMLIGGFIFAANAPLYGAYPMVAAVTIMWATRNPNTIVMLIVFPIKAKWLGWVSAGIVFFSTLPQFAIFAAAPLALAWAFADNRLPIRYGVPPAKTPTKRYRKHWKEDEGFHDNVRKRETERAERQRLKELFEKSMINDPDEKK
jgi:Der1-like family